MKFNQQHLSYLSSCNDVDPQDQKWPGGSPLTWYQRVTKGRNLQSACENNLHKQGIKRKELKEICADYSNSDLEVAVSVLAWGGMRRRNGAMLFEAPGNWLPVVSELRSGSIDHIAAFTKFTDCIQRRQLPGMGPAFFTKLIFFLQKPAARPRGYIMDQWTARSINLLCDHKVVDLTKQGGNWQVSSKNDANVYQRFCAAIEALADHLGVDGEEAELRIFSFSEPRKNPERGRWRDYVRENT